MQLYSVLATLLLAAPTIITAAPVADANGVAAINDVFARYDATCNPQFSSVPAVREKQKESEQRMKDLTVEYHKAEKQCPSNAKTTFGLKGTSKSRKTELKSLCVNGWAECAKKRVLANKACVAAGGTTDPGHEAAVKFCKDRAAEWRAKKV